MTEDDDRSAIQALLLDYSWAIDSKDWTLFRECFTEDCEVYYGVGNSPHPSRGAMSFISRSKLVEFIERTHQPLDGSLHSMSNIAIRIISPDTASSRVYGRIILVLKSHPDGPDYESAGYYLDDLVKRDGKWRIKTRRYTRVWARGNGKVIQPT